MAEREVRVAFMKDNAQKKSDLFTGDGFQCDIICWILLHYLWKGN